MKPKILQEFDRLQEGESMVISNESNPFILYYQLLDDRGDSFSWEYLEKGPQKWRVRIRKRFNSVK
ncbi:DUF2249 domain-containing protein [Nafulsella turpanensis]|uniref:DUF2249 domain-containing protein n=1 Tax=Nafulsella turpanensis TaxID=1265690 RepID=UPI00191BED0D|nr:DUF2249 domain-containing protein [Nafulsella turpanensis]